MILKVISVLNTQKLDQASFLVPVYGSPRQFFQNILTLNFPEIFILSCTVEWHNKFLEEQVDVLISKNQALQILYLKHDNVYKTINYHEYKKLTKAMKI